MPFTRFSQEVVHLGMICGCGRHDVIRKQDEHGQGAAGIKSRRGGERLLVE